MLLLSVPEAVSSHTKSEENQFHLVLALLVTGAPITFSGPLITLKQIITTKIIYMKNKKHTKNARKNMIKFTIISKI